ncbi:GNAT family N-acetyltransferase [Lacrimispora algidixylanolytica]|uniref:GNAT family N-acetyltransferase n=1 Tax=Lacrimispora algidixylanolytica TaxID=94868 RepID=A0A419STV0_9FIRM|nr:GNAT family N-acetyltransferase [Lacrimispora algidixylanolytica]RKD28625.1 GNAT family N-acetyltransferase [Lacrimispora algidixylanolytica]
MAISIKKINHENLDELKEIGIETFVDTFKSQNSPENIKNYIDKAFRTEKLKEELANEFSDFYFICYNNETAGYLKINTDDSQTERMGDEAFEIERIYIRTKYQRKKLGEHLIHKAFEVAKSLNKRCIWLGVWEENHNALAFYKRMGFIPSGAHSFSMGEEKQTDIIMIKTLV